MDSSTVTIRSSVAITSDGARPYGSLFGRRPDLIDYGQVGFGRLPRAFVWRGTATS